MCQSPGFTSETIQSISNENLWFQQDGATAHTAGISMAALRKSFPQRLNFRFGDVPWPLSSSDIIFPTFFSQKAQKDA
jgi:hypothetical protein